MSRTYTGFSLDGEIISGLGSRRPTPPPGTPTLTLILTRGLLGWCVSWLLCLERLGFLSGYIEGTLPDMADLWEHPYHFSSASAIDNC